MTDDFQMSAICIATVKASRAAQEKSMGTSSRSKGSRSGTVELLA
jgi:hypothetical protein